MNIIDSIKKLHVGKVIENAVEIFVAPDGDDKNGNGSYEKPYASIDAAKVAVRKMKALK